MFKIFTLAAAVAIMPVNQQKSLPPFNVDQFNKTNGYFFNFKTTVTNNFFEPEKKSTEACSQNWMATAQENIRKSEYNFKWEEKLNAYCTPNRKNNFRFFYTDKGFVVEPRTTKIPIGEYDPVKLPDEIKYKTIPNWKVQFNLDKKQVGKGLWKVTENKAEYITNNITVQYINNDEGMRQNFIVHTPLSKNDDLKINFSIKTKLETVLKNNSLHFFHKKNTVLQYKDLKVWDAAGKLLPASIKKNKKNKFCIQVITKGAVYPITIDPISTTPASILESNWAGALMGSSVSSAGDVNGDGYSDVIAGAYFYSNGEAGEGAFYVFHGSATGVSTTAATMVESNLASVFLGFSVASAGDINGDGYSDIIAGAGGYSNSEVNEGAIYVYLGSATGINTASVTVIQSNLADARLGFSVSAAGDVNGDGFSDVIAGARTYDNVETDEGAFFVYHGSATGIIITPQAIVESNLSGAFLGTSVAGAGDVNGDGYSDVIAGAAQYTNSQTNEGAFYVHLGSPTGIITTPAAMVESNQASALLGYAVACAGDVNGDGYSDIIAGAPQYSNGQSFEGVGFIHHGSATGISLTASAIVESNLVNGFMANTGGVACAGDVNGDGYSDIIVGVQGYSNGEANEGAAFVFIGSLTGINTTVNAILESNQASASMSRTASAGDVNGDGYSDVIVGTSAYDNPEINEGAAFVYHGSAAGLSTTPNNTPDDANQAVAYFGNSVASAGDVNGDGYSDVIIGAYGYDDGGADEGVAFVYHGSATGLPALPNSILDDADQSNALFGNCVASAGDVNGDGYSDVIIGAYKYDEVGSVDEGLAFVYHGSATGLSASPNSILDDANQPGAWFGVSVASAGDVNSDGYGDVIVGAWWYDDGPNTDEGRAFVYHGSASGLSATPNSILDDADQLGAQFGCSVASAGDTNGDGFGDVIIGANGYDDTPNTDEGRAFVYHGSSAGLSAIPNNTPDDADQAIAYFGWSAASAGDVNGDGYGDVIIGAYEYDDSGNGNEGRAFVYHGSATGLSASPNSIPDDADQPGANFGVSVACAGDVNGDGYSDIIIGAYKYTDGGNTFEGRSFVYHGSATGLPATPNSTPDDANQNLALSASSVACAGDVNGDGYSDVIIGSYNYTDGGNASEGRAFVYQGNDSTTNKRNNLRLYNTDLTTPINNSNFNSGNFGAGLYAKSFLGRNKGKLVWETRLNYNAYSGTPITNSTFFTAQQATYTNLGLTGVELKNIINKIAGASRYTKLRARVKYDPVTAITGQVYSPWRNVSSIIDANNLGALPIELISFNAAWLQKGKTARLDFTTDKESGICCFDIEKSLDGFNFYSIGTLPAKNTSGIQSYSFIDNNAKNKNQFYRLKIKGIAGKIEYSNIQQLQNNGNTEILVFPNPTTDVLQLQLNSVFDIMDVQIINSAGQTVKKMQLAVTNQTIGIPVQNLTAGKYWLHLQSGNEKQALQFVKQ